MLKTSRLLSNTSLLLKELRVLPVLRNYATKPSVDIEQQDNDERISQATKDTQHIISVIPQKKRVKKPGRRPFVKDLFLGKFDGEVLTYPQLEKDELEVLNKNLQPVKDFFDRKDVQEIDRLNSDFTHNLSHLSLYGLRAPQNLGGRDLSITETCRFSEILAGHNLKGHLIFNEQYVIQLLLKCASDTLKAKYLPKFISGEANGALCVTEPDLVDIKHIKTTARKGHDGTWVLNGMKSCVLNANSANTFVVLAFTGEGCSIQEMNDVKLSMFVVDRNAGGVTVNKTPPLAENFDLGDVSFNNTPVPEENVLGFINSGHILIGQIVTEVRLSFGPLGITLMKNLLQSFIDHFKTAVPDGHMTQVEAVQLKAAQLSTWLYAVESATYLTSGLLDHYQDQDCDLEAAIVKVLASDYSLQSTLLCLDFLGTPSILKDHWCNKFHREALGYTSLNDGNASLKLLISLTGLQHAGKELQGVVNKLRNPFVHPFASFKHMWTQKRQMEDNPKLLLELSQYLHPALVPSAEMLEYSVVRLQFAVEQMLLQYGAEVVNRHGDLERLAECAIDVYAMTACLGRASRSYCIGLRNAALEIFLAQTFCMEAKERVKKRVNNIWNGNLANGDQNRIELARETFTSGQYFPEHPLARNF